MENKNGWSWMGFLFAPHYYAGYGQLKKGLVLAVISGIMPLVAIAVGVYGGLKARKELPIKEIEFNWKNVAFTVITMIVVSLISMTVISGMKEGGSESDDSAITSSDSGSSLFGSGGAMPLTQENVDEYTQRVNEAAQNVDQSMEMFEKMYEILKKPLEDMGYDFDATILNTIKASYNQEEVSGRNAISDLGIILITPLKQGIFQDPEGAVSTKFISQETLDKLNAFENLRNVKDIESMQNFFNLVLECEKQGNGICHAAEMLPLLQETITLPQQEVVMNAVGEVESVNSDSSAAYMTYVGATMRMFPLLEQSDGKYKYALLKTPNGEEFYFGRMVNGNGEFILDKSLYNEFQNDVKNIWWQ